MGAVAAEVLDVLAAHAQVALPGPHQDFLFLTHHCQSDHELLARLEAPGRNVDQLVALAFRQFRYVFDWESQQEAVGGGADDGSRSAGLNDGG